MVKYILIITSFSFLLNISNAHSQTITSSGETTATENFVITSSLGETFNSISQGATEGFLVGYNIVIEEITDIKSPRNFQISLYPNPTKDFINLESKDVHDNLKISLFDVNGKENILTTTFNSDGKCQIAVQNLSAGMYFIKIVNEATPNYPQIFKIIKK